MNNKKMFSIAVKQLSISQVCILAMEEISELITEISSIKSCKSSDHLCEELVDVCITINLVKKAFKIKKSVIKEDKKKYKKDMKKGFEKNSNNENIKTCILELTNLQKVICKRVRGRHNKSELVEAIAKTDIVIDYLISTKTDIKDYKKWTATKLKRLSKRVDHNHII